MVGCTCLVAPLICCISCCGLFLQSCSTTMVWHAKAGAGRHAWRRDAHCKSPHTTHHGHNSLNAPAWARRTMEPQTQTAARAQAVRARAAEPGCRMTSRHATTSPRPRASRSATAPPPQAPQPTGSSATASVTRPQARPQGASGGVRRRGATGVVLFTYPLVA